MADRSHSRALFSRKKTGQGPYLSMQAATPPRKRKVLMIAHNHPGFFPGGGEMLAYQLFQQLNEHPGYEAVFLAATSHISREAHPGTAFLAYDGRPNEYLFYGDRFDYFMQSQKQPEFLYRDFANFLRELQPDVVHLHHTLRLGMEALQVIRNTLPSARIIYTLHDFIPLCYRDGQMIRTQDDVLCDTASPARCHACFPDIASARFMLREQFIKTHFALVDAFASPSRLLMERFAAWGLPKEKLHLVPNGTPHVLPAPPRPIARDEGRGRFGFFGQISHYKGTLLLTDAARLLAAREDMPDFSITIHGNPSLQPAAWQERFFSAVAACPQVHYTGVYAPEDLPALMAAVDWVVMPSLWWENAPLVINEAFRHGRPVICSDIGGMAEHVRHGVNGLHFRTGNAQSLAETMHACTVDSRLWEELRTQITPPPTIQGCVDKYLRLYYTATLPVEQSA